MDTHASRYKKTNKIVIFAVSKDGCFKRAEIVKIGGVNLVKINFVDLKRNQLTIKNMGSSRNAGAFVKIRELER